MALKSMEITAAERKAKEKEYKSGCVVGSVDEYPYGLRLDLNTDSLKKLGMASLPKVGTTMMLQARVKVVATRQSDRANGKDDRSVELQITEMDLGAKAAGSAVDALSEGVDEA